VSWNIRDPGAPKTPKSKRSKSRSHELPMGPCAPWALLMRADAP
jgi:hypothetical protein